MRTSGVAQALQLDGADMDRQVYFDDFLIGLAA